ncbi:MAG: hypothetical protein Q9165_002599 [Trypethelium subeluteriae]
MAMHVDLPTTAGEGPGPFVPPGEDIETVASPDALPHSNGSILSPGASPHGSNYNSPHQDGDDDLQNHWQDAMCRYMSIPTGYQDVAVLLIRWDDNIDELKCANQVDELRNVFEEQFHFTTELLKLDDKSKAQHQLKSALSAFLGRYDNPNNLVIVFYTGHGVFDERKEHLELAASREYFSGNNLARASWNTAEDALIEEVECDVLSILDCCFASDIQRNEKKERHEEGLHTYFERHMRRDKPDLPTYELLTAAGPGHVTSARPESSFTGKLIRALSHLAQKEKPFSTHDLNQRVIGDSDEEPNSCLFTRDRRSHTNTRHIQLRRLDRNPRRQNSFNENPIRSYLTLKFALRTESLTKTQADDLAKRLTNACKGEDAIVKVRRIDWISLRSPQRPSGIRHTMAVIRGVRKWRRATMSRKQSEGYIPLPSPIPSPNLEVPRIEIPLYPEPARPRRVNEVTISPSPTFVLFGFAFEILGVLSLLVVIAAFFLFGSGLELSSDWN